MSPVSLSIPRGQEPYINIGDILRDVYIGQGGFVTDKGQRTVKIDCDDWGDWGWREYPDEARAALRYFEDAQHEWDPSVRINVNWLEDEFMPRLTAG